MAKADARKIDKSLNNRQRQQTLDISQNCLRLTFIDDWTTHIPKKVFNMFEIWLNSFVTSMRSTITDSR